MESAIGTLLRRAREAVHLEVADFAELVEADVAELIRIEAGSAEADPALVDRCARLFGLRTRDLLHGGAPGAPLAVLLRSVYDQHSRPSLAELLTTELHHDLGEFLRVVRDVAEIEVKLGRKAADIPPIGGAIEASIGKEAERRARLARLRVGVDLEAPIPSMREILSALGARLFWTIPEDISVEIQGASTLAPRPAVLVNLIDGPSHFWCTRMTLAHELGHLLFDQRERSAWFSPRPEPRSMSHVPRQWNRLPEFVTIEQIADAFAACFLAPGSAVQRLVGSRDPVSAGAIAAVRDHFGVGHTVAINRLQDVFKLDQRDRNAMLDEPRGTPMGFEEDIVLESEIGLRAADVRRLAIEAFSSGVIGGVRCREYLGLELTDAIPGQVSGLPGSEPLLSTEDVIRERAQAWLWENPPGDHLCDVARSVLRDGERFVVEVTRGPVGGAGRPAGHVEIDRATRKIIDHRS